jgi:hypothetical protein
MVTRSYMLEKPAGPSKIIRAFHWHAMPAIIDSLSAAEERLATIRKSIQRSPAPALTCAFALGAWLGNRSRRG